MKIIKNKYFLVSFFVTLIIILFLSFLVITDYNCREDLFGASNPPLSFTTRSTATFAHIEAFGKEKTVDVSALANFLRALSEFICIPLD